MTVAQLLSGNINQLLRSGLAYVYPLLDCHVVYKITTDPKERTSFQSNLICSYVVNAGFLIWDLKTLYDRLNAGSIQQIHLSLKSVTWNTKNVMLGLSQVALLAGAVYGLWRLYFPHTDESEIKVGTITLLTRTKTFLIQQQKIALLFSLSRTVVNLAVAYLSQDRLYYLYNAASQAFQFYVCAQRRQFQLEKSFVFPENQRKLQPAEIYQIIQYQAFSNQQDILEIATRLQREQHIGFIEAHEIVMEALGRSIREQITSREKLSTVGKITFQFDTLLIPVRDSDECVVCFEPGLKVYSCSSHKLHAKCWTDWFSSKSENILNNSNVTLPRGSSCNISLLQENLPSCPTCRGRPVEEIFNAKVWVRKDNGSLQELSTYTTINPSLSHTKEEETSTYFEHLGYLVTVLRGMQAALSVARTKYPEFASKIVAAQVTWTVLDIFASIANLFGLYSVVNAQGKKDPKAEKPLTKQLVSLALSAAVGVYLFNKFGGGNPFLEKMVRSLPSTAVKDLKVTAQTPVSVQLVQWLYLTDTMISFFIARHTTHKVSYYAQSLFQMSRFFTLATTNWISFEKPFESDSYSRGKLSGRVRFDFFVPSANFSLDALEGMVKFVNNCLRNLSWTAWTRGYGGPLHHYSTSINPPSFANVAVKPFLYGASGISGSIPLEISVN
jgi:hypothetical protein